MVFVTQHNDHLEPEYHSIPVPGIERHSGYRRRALEAQLRARLLIPTSVFAGHFVNF